MILMQTLKILDDFYVQISARSIIHCCFVDQSLKKRQSNTEETLGILIETLKR